MVFGNAMLLAIGAGLITIPIVLHLIMQQKPKHQIFPALRFLQERRETNQRKLQLRHWLLLLLRCLVIAALVVAFAQPSVASNIYGAWMTLGAVGLSALLVTLLLIATLMMSRPLNRLLTAIFAGLLAAHFVGGGVLLARTLQLGENVTIGNRTAPIATVLIFDTSPRMGYLEANRSRLDVALGIADQVIDELPLDSRVAVLESREEVGFFSVDITAARKRMATLQPQFEPVPIPEALRRALALLEDAEEEQKEIYVFTDLSRQAWQADRPADVRALLEQNDRVALYLIDVGAARPTNVFLNDMRLRAQSITTNGKLQISGELGRLGEGGTRTVELVLEKPDPRRPQRQDGRTLLPEESWKRRQQVEFGRDGRTGFSFELGGLVDGIHQGQVRIVGEDGLSFDDQRYLTVEVRSQWKTLIVRPQNVSDTNVTELLSPYSFRQSGLAMFDCQVIRAEKLSSVSLQDFASVFLLDPAPISEAGWGLLRAYVEQGGGLFIMLGHNATDQGGAHPSFNTEAAQHLLPGALTEVWRGSDGQLFLDPQDLSHEILAPFRQIRSTVPWVDFPVHRHWGLRATDQQAASQIRVVVRYSNRMPALVEKTVGEGRVLTMTTPFTDPAQPPGRRRWNDLPLGECWPSWLLLKQSAEYLVQSKQSRINYSIGETAFLENDPSDQPTSYQMFTPRDEDPRPVSATDNAIRFRFTDVPGAYRLKGIKSGPVIRGFSVNAPVSASDLARKEEQELESLLGEGRYQLARNHEELQREQGMLRRGQEFYPLLILFLVLCLALEWLLANRFYSLDAVRNRTETAAERPARAVHA